MNNIRSPEVYLAYLIKEVGTGEHIYDNNIRIYSSDPLETIQANLRALYASSNSRYIELAISYIFHIYTNFRIPPTLNSVTFQELINRLHLNLDDDDRIMMYFINGRLISKWFQATMKCARTDLFEILYNSIYRDNIIQIALDGMDEDNTHAFVTDFVEPITYEIRQGIYNFVRVGNIRAFLRLYEITIDDATDWHIVAIAAIYYHNFRIFKFIYTQDELDDVDKKLLLWYAIQAKAYDIANFLFSETGGQLGGREFNQIKLRKLHETIENFHIPKRQDNVLTLPTTNNVNVICFRFAENCFNPHMLQNMRGMFRTSRTHAIPTRRIFQQRLEYLDDINQAIHELPTSCDAHGMIGNYIFG